jgi:hypothetical protein
MGGIWAYIEGALGARNRLFRVYLGCRRRILGMYMPPAATRCCDNKAAINGLFEHLPVIPCAGVISPEPESLPRRRAERDVWHLSDTNNDIG